MPVCVEILPAVTRRSSNIRRTIAHHTFVGAAVPPAHDVTSYPAVVNVPGFPVATRHGPALCDGDGFMWKNAVVASYYLRSYLG